MASSAPRSGDRAIQQDYIARIRYSNALPPPPHPPKLLDIPNTGLSSGQYTNPGFASRLAREQPLNIEADAELGMPIDLVGMPGIFDGDESSIQAPLTAPAPHPNDRALLRPLATLGKSKSTNEGHVSFLRRTEFISSTSSSRGTLRDPNARPMALRDTNRTKPLPRNTGKEDPAHIKAKAERSFDLAKTRLANANTLRHPSKRGLKSVSCLPILPDLNAMSEYGGYVTVKFQPGPLQMGSKYDHRLEDAILLVDLMSEEEELARQEQAERHRQDPKTYRAPPIKQDYNLYLLTDGKDQPNYKRMLDELDPERNDTSLYGVDDEGNVRTHFNFEHLRAYETSQSIEQFAEKYNKEVVLASYDGRNPQRQKAAYYYPIIQRQTIRPKRKEMMDEMRYGNSQPTDQTKQKPDTLYVMVEEPSEEEKSQRAAWGANPLTGPVETDEPAEESGTADNQDGDMDIDRGANGDAEAEDASQEANGTNGTNGIHGADSEMDQDASGSEE